MVSVVLPDIWPGHMSVILCSRLLVSVVFLLYVFLVSPDLRQVVLLIVVTYWCSVMASAMCFMLLWCDVFGSMAVIAPASFQEDTKETYIQHRRI